MSWWFHKCCKGKGKPCPICSTGFLPAGGWKVETNGWFNFGCSDCEEFNGTFYCTETDGSCTGHIYHLPAMAGDCCCLFYEFPAPICDVTRLEVWMRATATGAVWPLVLYRSGAGPVTCPPSNLQDDPTILFGFGATTKLGNAPFDCAAVSRKSIGGVRYSRFPTCWIMAASMWITAQP